MLAAVDGRRLDGRRQLLDGAEPGRARAGSHGRHAQPRRLPPARLRTARLAGQPRRLRPGEGAGRRSATPTARRRSRQNCLLARRLVEAGVPLVTVYSFGNRDWDTHGDNFTTLKNTLLPADRPRPVRAAGRPGRPRSAGRDAGRLDGRHGPHAAHQQGRGPRSLVVLLFGRAGRRRRPGRAGVRLVRPQRGLSVHQPGRPGRHRRDDLPLPRHRPEARSPISKGGRSSSGRVRRLTVWCGSSSWIGFRRGPAALPLPKAHLQLDQSVTRQNVVE